MPFGNLVFTLRTAVGALPVNNGSVTVTDSLGSTVFYEFLTAASDGLSRTVSLEAPSRALSLESDEPLLPYSLYDVSVRADGWYRMQIIGVQLFEGSTTLLPVELVPLPAGISSPDDADVIVIRIPEHTLRSGSQGAPSQPTSGNAALPAVNIIEGVYIPETITVHLGPPDSDEPNVTVSFIDYLKNVASSEIYPTWPTESLRANVIAQASLALNRIYTEWYRSQGYDFDITSSTAFDQAFVYGRNVFEETSAIVDELFNRYIVRPNSISPLFASYCNGTTSTCAGLSQWGTVALAESGQTNEEILGFYYGDIEITETDDIRTPEESYPGAPLRPGDSGDDVRIIQEQLNRIAINFPLLPLIEVNGVYNEQTESTVREFQRLFILPTTGITDKATWYRISQIYASVKRLAEITSEGQRASYNSQLYPGTPLRLYSRGSEVQELQFYLQRISRFNPVVESPELDGIYGTGTQNAVISFQNAYGLSPTGIVAEADWNRLVEVYNGTLDNVDEPQNGITPVPYPGYILAVGSRGEYVRYVQQLLNVINNVFLTIPELAEDGIFGNATRGAVNTFASLFGLPQSGRVDEALWNKLNAIYATVLSGCIFSSSESVGARPFSGTEQRIGSSGADVSYIQERINIIAAAIPYVGTLTVDGLYGSATSNSVSALQRVFGLTESGTVNETTWLLVNYITAAVVNGCLPTDASVPSYLSGAEALTASASSSSASPASPTPASLSSVSETCSSPNADRTASVRVSELKELMKQNGIAVGSGPMFGLRSRRSLALWQAMRGLEPTGLPDSATRAKLLENTNNSH
ncbi:MAG: peptidoglycan-binding protein [Clostridia bacterium]|nr:peptidoglycan-binding protein [Clostridia bacterium]